VLDEQLRDLLKRVVQQGASDLHLSANNPPILRLKGALVPLSTMEKITPERMQKMVIGLLSGIQYEKLVTDKELDLSIAIPDIARFRANIFFEQDAMGAVFRVIPSVPRDHQELGVPLIIRELAQRNQGMILVTGPSGSGKTTTLASTIEYINMTRNCHVVTIEDPIEYTYVNKKCLIRQREVGVHTNSFSNALTSVLRQDPDIILVGEMRDLETMRTALTAAETGHLVFSTLHTNGTVDSINRIIDVFPPGQQSQVRLQLATTLEGVFSQILIPRTRGKGMILATEIMIATPAVRNLIREARTHHIRSILETGAEYGMQTMESCLKQLVTSGLITYEDALARAYDVESFKQIMS
jgi:twitching motility protein PilT